MNLDSYTARLGEVREAASSEDGLVQVVADATGKVVDLRVKAELLRRSPHGVAQVVLATITKAQDAARARTSHTLDELRESLDKQVNRDVEEAKAFAERSTAEFDTMMADLARRVGSPR